jgi:formylglycine-generating enzyme required for sulfatase activity
MGSPTTEAGRGSDETQHQVTLTNGFYLGKYEVTQAQYETVMTGNSEGLNADPSHNNHKGINRPVDQVSWNDVQVFLSRLNDMEEAAGRLPAGWKYVLPTEAQWEYACRAGTTTRFSWGDGITSLNANYGQNIGQTTDVGNYAANPWGFFDMHGNVWEWTADAYQTAYPIGNPVINPAFPVVNTTSQGVFRGGSLVDSAPKHRSAQRYDYNLLARQNNIGFRVSLQKSQ